MLNFRLLPEVGSGVSRNTRYDQIRAKFNQAYDLQNRFQSCLDNYNTARKYGANFIFLIHDLWGADGTQNSSAPYPGDNGDWSYWDDYFNQLIADMQANNMIDGVVIDLWNEPDGNGFWARSQDQYLQYWGRSYDQFR